MEIKRDFYLLTSSPMHLPKKTFLIVIRALLEMVIILTNELLLHKFVQPTIYSGVYQIVAK